ncbi:hypothetical protein MMC34_001219 [Xylographa carneopallida]|nr:hypothetical protein [Xylographa carneopallida]
MDTYTRASMAAIIPSLGSLESIGSASANWSRRSDDTEEFLRYSNTCPLAENILATQGVVAYEAYLAEIQARKTADRIEAEKSRERKRARRAAVKRYLGKLKNFVGRHWPMLG